MFTRSISVTTGKVTPLRMQTKYNDYTMRIKGKPNNIIVRLNADQSICNNKDKILPKDLIKDFNSSFPVCNRHRRCKSPLRIDPFKRKKVSIELKS